MAFPLRRLAMRRMPTRYQVVAVAMANLQVTCAFISTVQSTCQTLLTTVLVTRQIGAVFEQYKQMERALAVFL